MSNEARNVKLQKNQLEKMNEKLELLQKSELLND